MTSSINRLETHVTDEAFKKAQINRVYPKGEPSDFIKKFSTDANPRQTPEQLINNSEEMENLEQELDKAKDFVIKTMLAKAKNPDILGEKSNDSGDDMMKLSEAIHRTKAVKLQVGYMKEMAHAIKNPGFSATDIQGKLIQYDDSKRYYDGKNPVTFNFKLSHNQNKDKDPKIKARIRIKNSNNEIVFTDEITSSLGDNEFIWKPKNIKGKELKSGEYTIEIKATGSKYNENGEKLRFPVNVTTALEGVVKNVEISNGISTSIILDNGAKLGKDQVIGISNAPEQIKPDNIVSADMIGTRAEIDLSKFQITNSKPKAIELYYHNEFKDNKGAEIEIFNSNGKLVKTIEYSKKLPPGIHILELDKRLNIELSDLEEGNYTTKIKIKKTDKDGDCEKLENNLEVFIRGINIKENKIISEDEMLYNAHLIDNILGRFQSTLEQAQTALQGKEVQYNKKEFIKINGFDFNFEYYIDKPDYLGTVYQSNLMIYNEENELIQIVKQEADLYRTITPEAQKIIDDFISDKFEKDEFKSKDYYQLSPKSRSQVNMKIEEEIKKDQTLIKGEYLDNYSKRQVKFNYRWDGLLGPMAPKIAPKAGTTGQKITALIDNYYSDHNGDIVPDSNFKGPYTRIFKAKVDEIEMENGDIHLSLSNGDRITYDQIVVAESKD